MTRALARVFYYLKDKLKGKKDSDKSVLVYSRTVQIH
jgi:hypothetical protein